MSIHSLTQFCGDVPGLVGFVVYWPMIVMSSRKRDTDFVSMKMGRGRVLGTAHPAFLVLGFGCPEAFCYKPCCSPLRVFGFRL